MVRADLEIVGIPYHDEGGRVFDFHALRHQFISSLAAAGVHPKVAQTLARHSTITLTMDRYTHVGLYDQTAALDQLPALPASGPVGHAETLAATGTDGKQDLLRKKAGKNLGPNLGPSTAISGDSLRQVETEKGGRPPNANVEDAMVSASFSRENEERPLPDSNRGWRICNPLPYRLAKGPKYFPGRIYGKSPQTLLQFVTNL